MAIPPLGIDPFATIALIDKLSSIRASASGMSKSQIVQIRKQFEKAYTGPEKGTSRILIPPFLSKHQIGHTKRDKCTHEHVSRGICLYCGKEGVE